MSNVINVEGIGEVYAGKLKAVGVTTDKDLLDRGGTREGRKKLAEESGIAETLILRWVNHVDLFRIKGVEGQYAELLEASGVDSVPELAQRVPANLHAKIVETNAAKHLVRQLPSEGQVAEWIGEAKTLPRIVTH
jgi:predicted flap endonuclease-1-like 5' DNA nuclease